MTRTCPLEGGGVRVAHGMSRDAVLGELELIRGTLLCDFLASGFVIPREADLTVLSLRAQVERALDQLQFGHPAQSAG